MNVRKMEQLETLLESGKWEEANKKTMTIVRDIYNEINETFIPEGKHLDSKGFQKFPCDNLNKIDELWKKYSDEKFGFSVQKDIYLNAGGNLDDSPQGYPDPARPEARPEEEVSEEFSSTIEWENFDNPNIKFNDFDNAPKGHLPYWYKELGQFGGFKGLFRCIEICKTC